MPLQLPLQLLGLAQQCLLTGDAPAGQKQSRLSKRIDGSFQTARPPEKRLDRYSLGADRIQPFEYYFDWDFQQPYLPPVPTDDELERRFSTLFHHEAIPILHASEIVPTTAERGIRGYTDVSLLRKPPP